MAWLQSPPNSSNAAVHLWLRYRQKGDWNVSEMKWVPGFIWLTPRGPEEHKVVDGKNVWHYTPRPPMLVAVSQITDVCAVRPDKTKPAIADSCVSMSAGSDAYLQVVETVEEIAELIRQEWKERTITAAIAAAQYGSGEYVMKESGK